jgi:uncharacterized protein (UPF0305 family)
MKKPKISPNFTVEDIHKIRRYTYELTKNMTYNERMDYINKKADNTLKAIEKIRKEKGISFN